MFDMTTVTTMRFNFDDGEDWYYDVTAYSDIVEFMYYEDGNLKQSFNMPTFVAAKMLEHVAKMAKDKEDE